MTATIKKVTSSSVKERIHWVDQAKAIGLFVVMLVHGPIPLLLEHYLRSFSMPRFFIIAGLFISLHQPFLEYVKAKAKRLVIPYFAFAFLSYCVWLIYRQVSTVPDAQADPLKTFLWMFYANGGGNLVFNRPLWFLPCLFTTLLGVYFLVRIPKPYVYGVLGLCAVVGYFTMGQLPFRPPWSLDLILTTASLTTLGFLWRDKIIYSTPLSLPMLLLWTVISLTTAMTNEFVRLSGADVGNFFLFYVASFAGTVVTLDIVKHIPYNRILSYIGQHTMPIYALHVLVYMFLYEFVGSFQSSLDIHPLAFQSIQLVAFLALGLGIPLVCIWLYDQTKLLLRSLVTKQESTDLLLQQEMLALEQDFKQVPEEETEKTGKQLV
jgi:acyltransferase